MMYRFIFLISCIVRHLLADDYFIHWFDDQRREVYDEPIVLPVENGPIPEFLINGSLIRAGPSIGHTQKRNYTNYIDFFGRITKWSFKTETLVNFQSALIKSNVYNSSNNISDIPIHLTSEKPYPKFRGIPDLKNMDNTNVFMYAFQDANANRILTFTDFHTSNDIHIESMRTLGNTLYNDTLESIWSSSHPQEYRDPENDFDTVLVNWIGTKSIHDIGNMKLCIYKMGKDLIRRQVGCVEIPFLPYSIHSIAVAGDWAIVQIGPVELNMWKSGITDTLSESTVIKLDTDPTMIYVFDLKSSSEPNAKPIYIFTIPSPDNFFSFHKVNAVIKEDFVIELDLCVYLNMEGILGEHVLGNLKDIFNSSVRDNMPYDCDALRRLSLNTKTGTYSFKDFQILDEYGNNYRLELVIHSPKFTNTPYCFVYAPVKHFAGSPRYQDMGIIKINLCMADATVNVVGSFHENNTFVGEPIFVPDPSSNEEDRGVLLVITRTIRENLDESYLIVLNASNMNLISTTKAPFTLPFEFHGNYFDFF